MNTYPIYLDIETIPAQRSDVRAYFEESMRDELAQALEAVKAPSNYKDEAKIAEYIENAKANLKADFAGKLADKIDKTGLDGAFGQIVCIGYDMHDDGASTTICSMDEGFVLSKFNQALTDNVRLADQVQITIVGHNVAAFDLRFLLQRYIVNGIRPHPVIWRAAQAKPWESDRVYDTMVQFAGVGNRISLDKLCLSLGIEGKCMTTGADVWPMVQAGRLEEVARYCENDVSITRAAYRRMTFQAE